MSLVCACGTGLAHRRCIFTRNDALADKRYRAQSEVPRSVLESMHSDVVHSPGFSIKGEARQGRAAYLDFQATTPMDPRVVDAMVSQHDTLLYCAGVCVCLSLVHACVFVSDMNTCNSVWCLCCSALALNPHVPIKSLE